MKNLMVFSVLVFAFFGSCVSFSSESSSWVWKEEETKAAVKVVSVYAEKSGVPGSLEKEIEGLLPLLFSERGFVTVSSPEEAAYFAEVNVREREYPYGWKTVRSLSVEVKLWDGEDWTMRPLPLSAGRVVKQGTASFSSSGTLTRMLRKAVRNAVHGLSPGENNE